MTEIRLGKILGIEIDITYNWFFIFALVTVSLTFGVFPLQLPGAGALAYALMGLVTSVLFFVSLLTHEMMHSVVANRNGIPIKKITLFVFGGMAQMSGEPGGAASEFRMAIVGPATSALLAGLFVVVSLGFRDVGLPSTIWWPLLWLADINFFLALFNLLPGFPLDGGRIFRSIMWGISGNMEKATNIASKTGQVVALMMIAGGVWLFFLTGNIGGLWLVLIGWFLYQAAVGSYRQLLLQHALEGVRVSDIMSAEVETVMPALSLRELVSAYFMKYRFSRFPVVSERGDIVGVVTLHDVKSVSEDEWDAKKVGEVVEPLTAEAQVSTDDPALTAFIRMAQTNTGHLLVVDQGHLVGIITRTDVMRLISMKMELGGK